ncbi:unnamed protein product, partial [Meganyctiphanes norvegica]
RMDFLECKICHVPYDEEDYRPRNSLCGHELCTACLRELIKDSKFECPKCRKINKVDVPEDLPVCFGLIDVIRAFKAKHISLTNESEHQTPGATNGEICKLHQKAIGHRCLKCQLWICDDCVDNHSTLLGCSTISSSNAVDSMKEKQTQSVDMLLTSFVIDANYLSSKIHENSNKRKELLDKVWKLAEDEEKIKNLLAQGNIHKEKLEECKNHLKETSSPFEIMDRIEMLTQRKQLLRSWSVKTLGSASSIDFLKTLKEEKKVYAEMIKKDIKKHAKISQHEERTFLHSFSEQTVADGSVCIPFDELQKMHPENTSLVFIELNQGMAKKGRILVQLDNDLPNIRKNIVQIFSGQMGPSLAGRLFGGYFKDDISMSNLPFNQIPVTPDSNWKTIAKQGDVFGKFSNGYLNILGFYVASPPKTHDYSNNCRVFGSIVDGLDILLECHNNNIRSVSISDCGLVIEHE